MKSNSSTAVEESPVTSTDNSKARLTSQQAANVTGKWLRKNLGERVAKINKGETVPQQ